MKNDINTLKNEVNELSKNIIDTNNYNKLMSEFKIKASEMFYFKIKDMLDYEDYSINDILTNKKNIIDYVAIQLQNIKSDKIDTNNTNFNKDVYIPHFDFKIDTIYYQLNIIFNKVYKQIIAEYKEIEKQETLLLESKLKTYLKGLFNTKNKNITYKELSNNLIIYKEDILQDITQNTEKQNKLDKMYIKVLNEVKKSYIDTPTPIKIPLGWKAYGIYKGLKTIIKL